MLTWCNNVLTVSGPKRSLSVFMKAAEGFDREYGIQRYEWLSLMLRYKGKSPNKRFELFCFNALLPVPDHILIAGFNPKGYDWEREHWGCQWGATDIERDIGDKEITYRFSTANAPPLVLLDKVAADHPQLALRLKWAMDGSNGTVEWKGERI